MMNTAFRIKAKRAAVEEGIASTTNDVHLCLTVLFVNDEQEGAIYV